MEREFPEGNDTVLTKGECPQCGSPKGFVTYSDGHATCYSQGCGHKVFPNGSETSIRSTPIAQQSAELLSPDSSSWPRDGLPKRKLTLDTMRRFGVFTPGFKGEKVHCYPYYNQAGALAAQKLRTSTKDFPTLKNGEDYQQIGQCQLFGRHVFGDKYDRQVVITEGELDCMSVAQETDFKIAAVSLNSGAGAAAKVLKANYLWLDRFEDIVLWFDNDAPGLEAMEECAKLFKVGKVRIAKHTEFKDASDCLQANRPGDIKATIFSATKWRPKGIVNAADNPDDVTTPKEDSHAFSFQWPWPELTNMFGPILPGQVVYNVAGTGVGKSTFTNHVIRHIIDQGGKVGFFSFEGTRRETKLNIMTVYHGTRLDIEQLDDDTMRQLHALYFGNGKLELFDPETAEWSMEAIEGYVRYCAKALDCQVMVIDPLSFVVAGMAASDNQVQALDTVSRNLAAMAKELGIHLQISHHLARPQGTGHEEGAQTSINQVRGSGGIANFATIVIGHERNQQAEGEDYLLTQLRSLKNRPRSKTGPIMTVEYSLQTGRLTPTNRPFPAPGAKAGGGGGGNSHTPFTSVTDNDY